MQLTLNRAQVSFMGLRQSMCLVYLPLHGVIFNFPSSAIIKLLTLLLASELHTLLRGAAAASSELADNRGSALCLAV